MEADGRGVKKGLDTRQRTRFNAPHAQLGDPKLQAPAAVPAGLGNLYGASRGREETLT